MTRCDALYYVFCFCLIAVAVRFGRMLNWQGTFFLWFLTQNFLIVSLSWKKFENENSDYLVAPMLMIVFAL